MRTLPHSWCLVLAATLLSACTWNFQSRCLCAGPEPTPAPAPDTAPDAEPAPGPAPAPAPPAPYDALLRPWHHFDPGWIEQAEIVVVGSLEQGTYPCIFEPDGSHRMPLRSTITIDQVLRGTVARPDIDFAALVDPSLAFPLEFHEGRRYLLFLSPDDEARAHLQDPERVFTVDDQLQPRHFVAIVDLDQTEAEAAAHRRRVARWQELERFEFTPEGWQRMRESASVDLGLAESFLHAFRQRLVRSWERRRENVRATLGPPDEVRQEDGDAVEVYHLGRTARRAPVEGTLYARIELTFQPDGTLVSYTESYEVFADGRLREAEYEEYTARGLTTWAIHW